MFPIQTMWFRRGLLAALFVASSITLPTIIPATARPAAAGTKSVSKQRTRSRSEVSARTLAQA